MYLDNEQVVAEQLALAARFTKFREKLAADFAVGTFLVHQCDTSCAPRHIQHEVVTELLSCSTNFGCLVKSRRVREQHAVRDGHHANDPDHSAAQRWVNRIGRRDSTRKIVPPARKSLDRTAAATIRDGGREWRYSHHPAFDEVAVG
jgi:hypothetical protein